MGNRSWSDLSRYPFIEIESDVIRKQRMKAPRFEAQQWSRGAKHKV